MSSTADSITKILYDSYGLKVTAAKKSSVGAGSDTWFVTCEDSKYVVKFPSESDINNPELEPKLCEFLLEQGIPVCQFIKNKVGQYVSADEQGRIFHVQKFVEGTMYDWHEAPEWLLAESAAMLGKFHAALKHYGGLPTGIGEGFFKYMTPERAIASYRESLKIAQVEEDAEAVEDLQYRIGLMQRFPDYNFDLNCLTCQSTHGDYFISQLLCDENKINAVIDWTTACVHPVVWEIVRSYVYAAPSCKDGQIDMDEFVRYVKEYCNHAVLTEYDLLNMVPLFYYQIAVCDYYGQYYESDAANRHIYLEQAKFSTKLMRWFEKYGDVLTTKIAREIIFKKEDNNMKVLVLMGSPRLHGNTAELCKPFMEELTKQGAEVKYIELEKKTILPCKECYVCQEVSGEYGCAQKDDMPAIAEEMLWADCIILATPIFAWYCTTKMKAILDRHYGFNKYYGSAEGCLWEGKKVGIIATHGYDGAYATDPFEMGVERLCKHSNLEYIGMYSVQDEDNLASFQTEEAVEGAKNFAKKVVEQLQ